MRPRSSATPSPRRAVRPTALPERPSPRPPTSSPDGRRVTLRVSRPNALFQRLEALKRNRTKRHQTGEVFVEGVRPISRALAHGWTFSALAHVAGQPLSSWATGVLAAAPMAQRIELSPALMDALSEKADPSELLAVLAMPVDDLNRIRVPAGEAPLVSVFDRPVSPGNLGTIVRSCDALGAHGLIVTGHGADVYDPQTIRASQGSLFALPVVRLASHAEVAQWVEMQRSAGLALRVVGASGDAGIATEDADLSGPLVLVLGNETRGLSRSYRDLCDQLVRIPMSGTADSLNVASAASILLYEASRQRRSKGGAKHPVPIG